MPIGTHERRCDAFVTYFDRLLKLRSDIRRAFLARFSVLGTIFGISG